MNERGFVIIPFRSPRHAKTRLSGSFTPAFRRSLSMAMLERVYAAASNAVGAGNVRVVTADEAFAQSFEGHSIVEHTGSQNEALKIALDASLLPTERPTLCISADLPLVTENDVLRMLDVGPDECSLASDVSGLGTNAIAFRAGRRPPFLFGNKSLPNHRQACIAHGLSPKVVQRVGLSFDVDLPSDVATLCKPFPCGRGALDVEAGRSLCS